MGLTGDVLLNDEKKDALMDPNASMRTYGIAGNEYK